MAKYEKLQIDGVDYKTTLTEKWENRKPWVEPDPLQIEAYIPGTIQHINVKEGQEVEADETLLVLEAMKMNNKITAPCDAKVKKIYVQKGEQVPKGFLMMELE